jgi:uncharacterized metal-binding protein YceD (DUF177 family)
MNTSNSPYSVFLDLGSVPDQGIERTLSPNMEERQAIAAWLRVQVVESLDATVHVKRRSEDHYAYDARFEAKLVQACVVTLEPVPAQLSGEFHRDFRVRPKASAKKRRHVEDSPAAVELSGLDDEESDWLDQHEIDLAAPVLEELTLALDPYPRAPGAEFDVLPEEAAIRDNPFAVLEKLKTGQKQPETAGKRAEGRGKRK